MRLPSIEALGSSTRRVVERFPETVLVAAIAPFLGHFVTHGSPGKAEWAGWWAAAALGIPAYFTLAVTLERHPRSRFTRPMPRALLDLLIATPLVAFAALWPHWSGELQFRRLLHVALALHLLVAFVPFLGRQEPNGFWQYNRTLFVRFLTGGLFSAVLFGGLAVALAAGKPLFGVPIPGEVYFDLWLAIAFVFNTLFFLGGIPEDLSALEFDTSYPTGLRVFAQFILVPLVAVYLAILTAYLVRILVTGQWPNGWIGYLVSSVSVVGILALLLVHPVRLRAENQWVTSYARWFYLALLPSIGMLFAAIGKRIGQYGFTEDRYFLLALASWLAGIAVAYSVRRHADLRWIPITLCAVALVTLIGPWSAYDVPRADQTRRLMRILEANGLIEGGQPVRANAPLPVEVRRKLSSMLGYVVGTHGVRALPSSLETLASADSTSSGAGSSDRNGPFVAQRIMSRLGLQYVEPWQKTESRSFNYYSTVVGGVGRVQKISEFDYVVSINGNPPFDFDLGEGHVRVVCDRRAQNLVVERSWASPRTVPLAAVLRGLTQGEHPPMGTEGRPPIQIEAAPDLRLVARSIAGTFDGDSIATIHIDAELYLRREGEGPGEPARP